MRSLHKRCRDGCLGPGGWFCPCCAPAIRERKRFLRKIKRGLLRRLLDKLTNEQLSE